jgi:transcriptional regulator with XRE-family HTH domain
LENNLRKLRKNKHLTIRDVEAATGINRGKLSEIENGIRRPSYDQRVALNDFIGEDVAFWVKMPVNLDI